MAVESKSNRSCKHCLSNGRYIVEVTAVPVLDDVSASAGQLPTHLGRNIFTALCVSAVLAVCLSVCPSRSCIVSKWIKISSNFFLYLVAHHSSFWRPSGPPFPRGTPSVWALNIRSGGNFAIFDWNRRLSWKLYERGPWLLPNVNRKS